MNWPSFYDLAAATPGSFFIGGGIAVIVAIVQWFLHKPKERALTEKENALAEKERALADATKTDANIEVMRLWMAGVELVNKKLLESNQRLERTSERLQKSSDRLQRELNDTKQVLNDTKRVLSTLVDAVELFIAGDGRNAQQLSTVLERARALNNGVK